MDYQMDYQMDSQMDSQMESQEMIRFAEIIQMNSPGIIDKNTSPR